MKPKLKDTVILLFLTISSTLAVWLAAGLPKIYQNFDGPYYVVVAKTWYKSELIKQNFEFTLPVEYYAAHLPGYPFLIKLLTGFGFSNLQAGLVLSTGMAAATAILIYFIFSVNKWGDPLWTAALWLFVWPRMWAVRSVISPETLFLFCIVLSLYFFGKKQYLWAGLAGAGAVATKSPGILLLPAYLLYLIEVWGKTRKIEWKAWPILLIGAALVAVFLFYGVQMNDFWAYFHSGDNIHLQFLPFRIFDSSQSWVGTWWLEEVLWIYLIGGLGIYYAFKKSRVWGWFGAVFLTVLLFVSHRDISRYALPIVPVVLLGLSQLWQRREIKIALVLMLIPLYFYTVNFLNHNFVAISLWKPLL